MRFRKQVSWIVATLTIFSATYIMLISWNVEQNKFALSAKILKPFDWTDIECIRTKTLPSFTACLLPVKLSKVSGNLTTDGTWEVYLVNMLKKSFDIYPQATLIDVGANLGFFTMYAATLGHPVVAVEPIADTARRIQKSVVKDKVANKVTILNNAISDERQNIHIGGDDIRADYVKVMNNKEMHSKPKLSYSIAALVMNDLIRFVNTDIAILKIDIEGYECKAMKKMSELLQTIFIPYIFMEWIWIFRNQNKPNNWCSSAELRELVIRLLDAGYLPFDVKRRTTGRLDPHSVSTTWDVKDMGWRHKNAPHLLF